MSELKKLCEYGCRRNSHGDGDIDVRIEEGKRIISYHCNICGRTTVIIEGTQE